MSAFNVKDIFEQIFSKNSIQLFVGLTVVYSIARAIYLLYFHPLAKFPGPKVAAVTNVWYIYHWLTGRYPWAIEAAIKKYGDVVRIAPNEVVFFSAQASTDILLSGSKGKPVFKKSDFYFALGPHAGIAAERDPEKHRIIRKWMAPAFGPRAIKDQDPVIHRVIDLAVDKMALRGDVPNGLDMTVWCDWIACDLAGSLGYGHDYQNLEKEESSFAVRWFNEVSFWVTLDQALRRFPILHPLVYFMIPWNMVRLLIEHKRIVRKRVEKPSEFPQPDYFTSLLQEGRSIPNKNMDWITAQANHIFIGGADPDTNLFWSAILFLSQHPDKLRKFTDEIRGKFKSYDDISPEQLTHLPWLSGVIEESLRLHVNGAFGQPRVSPGATVDGHYIPAGCLVQTAIFAAFHSERYWHKSRDFCPERWLPATDPDYDPAFANDVRECFRPFSAGSRSCIGQNMGYRQARLLLAKMAWKLDWTLVENIDWEGGLKLYAIYHKPAFMVRYKLSDMAKAAAAQTTEKLVEV